MQGLTENVEHGLTHCVKYNEDRTRLEQRVREAGQGLDWEGTLGTNRCPK